MTALEVGCTSGNCDMAMNSKSLAGSGLGEVFGTAPWAGRENSYYVAGLAYYANTQDLRADLIDKQTVRTFMIDTQEFNNNPPLGPLNMLWLTGKYGGFVDANGDGDPNNGTPGASTAEWDADGDGQPDNYVLANRPDKMVYALKNAFDAIDQGDLSVAALASNSTSLNTSTHLYQARFNNLNWDGELFSYAVNASTGVVDSSPVWKASELMPRWSDRNIFTYNSALTTAYKGVKFRWGHISPDQRALLEPRVELKIASGVLDRKYMLQYIRGNRRWEQQEDGKFRNRKHFGDTNSHAHLGDIVNSRVAYVSNEYYGYDELTGVEGSSYLTFQNGLTRTPMLYVGGNDGMLHGINAVTGQEKFAYIPNAVIGDLKSLADPLYNHQYFVDASPRVGDAYFGSGSWKTVAVSSLGAGGKAIFALDITDPNDFVETSFDRKKVLWELSNNNDSDIGNIIGQASIVRLNNGSWAAIFGNGYDSLTKKATLFIVDIKTGVVIKKFETKQGDAGSPNGLSTPIAVDSDGDRDADLVYAGDLQGNLWKFDISDETSSNWSISFGDSATPEPLFKACNEDPCVNPQPISAKPQVGDHPDGGHMIYFGTGKFFETGDNLIGGSTQIQTFYGLRDNHEASDTTSVILGRDELQEQTIQSEVSVSGSTYRVTSNETVDYNEVTPEYGWYLDLLSAGLGAGDGERVISGSILSNGRIVFVSFIPNPDPCASPESSSLSWLMAMDAISGGPLDTSPFDINNDNSFTHSDDRLVDTNLDGSVDEDDDKSISTGARIDGGIGQVPVVLETHDDNLDKYYFSKKSGDIESKNASASRKRGRQTWLQF